RKGVWRAVGDTIAEPFELEGLYGGTPVEQVHRAAKLIWPRRGRSGLGARLLRWQGPLIGDVLAGSATVTQRLLDLAAIQLHLPSILDRPAPRGLSALHFGAAGTLPAVRPAANGAFTARSLA